MASRDFDAYVAEQSGKPFVTFTLGGTEFHVRNPMPAAPALQFLAAGASSLADWCDYLSGVLVETHAELKEAIHASGISAPGLMDIASWVSEESTKRPSEPSSHSRRRPSTTGQRGSSGSRPRKSTRATPLSVAS